MKVCCIGSVEEARLAVRHGAAALGLVSAMPSGPGVIPEERIREIAAAVPTHVWTVLLTSLTDPAAIVAQQRRCGVRALQLVDRLPGGAHRRLRAALPDVRILQVVHVEGAGAIEEARALDGRVDALLLDSGRPAAPTPELGGTGRVHDWRISREIRDALSTPVFLAGGLGPHNVADAIRAVRPYGLDLCTGLRTRGRLDEVKLADFMARVARTAVSGARERPGGGEAHRTNERA